MTDVEYVLAAALQLSPSARAAVAAELLESLEGLDKQDVHEEAVDAAWSEEIQKRVTEVDSGAVATVPWSQARERFLATANGRVKTR
jgi:Putative addiction module component